MSENYQNSKNSFIVFDSNANSIHFLASAKCSIVTTSIVDSVLKSKGSLSMPLYHFPNDSLLDKIANGLVNTSQRHHKTMSMSWRKELSQTFAKDLLLMR